MNQLSQKNLVLQLLCFFTSHKDDEKARQFQFLTELSHSYIVLALQMITKQISEYLFYFTSYSERKYVELTLWQQVKT